MSSERFPVRRELVDTFTGRLSIMANAAQDLGAEMAKRQATWEPHDWDDFE